MIHAQDFGVFGTVYSKVAALTKSTIIKFSLGEILPGNSSVFKKIFFLKVSAIQNLDFFKSIVLNVVVIMPSFSLAQCL